MATSSPYASISGRNRAIRDTWRANLAAKGPFSRRGARNHAWREDVASAARPFRGSGMRSGRTGFAPCGAHPACLPHAPPPAISLVPAAARAPCHLARVHRRRLTRVAFHHPHRAHRTPPSAASPNTVGGEPSTGCFLPPDLRPTHPASRALPADPDVDLPRAAPYARAHRCALAGTARPQPAPTELQPRANRTPAPSQPSPAHPWSRLRPPAPRHPPRLALPRGFRCGSGNSREMVR